MTVEALNQFMLSQGPSSAVVSLEWDSIWSKNKQIIDPIAPRHWAILEKDKVEVIVSGGPKEQEVKVLPKHKKNEAIGTKKTVFWERILIEQEDAQSFDHQEEVRSAFLFVVPVTSQMYIPNRLRSWIGAMPSFAASPKTLPLVS